MSDTDLIASVASLRVFEVKDHSEAVRIVQGWQYGQLWLAYTELANGTHRVAVCGYPAYEGRTVLLYTTSEDPRAGWGQERAITAMKMG